MFTYCEVWRRAEPAAEASLAELQNILSQGMFAESATFVRFADQNGYAGFATLATCRDGGGFEAPIAPDPMAM